MEQQDEVWTTNIGGRACLWTRVPNQRTRSGYSWTTPNVVSPAGFSAVVPPNSGHPHDVGWPVWGAGLLLVHSHDGPFGIYGSRIFVPWPTDSEEKRPILVENFDSPEQILLTCLLSAAGLWTDILPEVTMQEKGNWWLLHMYGESRWDYFDYDHKASRAKETLRTVAAVSFAFHRVFEPFGAQGSVRPSGHWGTFSRTPHVTSGASAMNALIRVHLFTLLYALMKNTHWCWWITYVTNWRWGKPRCRFTQLVVARTPCAVDVVMHCRWRIWLFLIGVTIHRRSVIHHSRHESTALQKTSVQGKSVLSDAIRFLGNAAVRGLKISFRRARPRARSTGMAGWGKWDQGKWI